MTKCRLRSPWLWSTDGKGNYYATHEGQNYKVSGRPGRLYSAEVDGQGLGQHRTLFGAANMCVKHGKGSSASLFLPLVLLAAGAVFYLEVLV